MRILVDHNLEGDADLLSALLVKEGWAELPIITVASQDCLKEQACRQAAALRLVEIVAYLERYLGTGRLYIP